MKQMTPDGVRDTANGMPETSHAMISTAASSVKIWFHAKCTTTIKGNALPLLSKPEAAIKLLYRAQVKEFDGSLWV